MILPIRTSFQLLFSIIFLTLAVLVFPTFSVITGSFPYFKKKVNDKVNNIKSKAYSVFLDDEVNLLKKD